LNLGLKVLKYCCVSLGTGLPVSTTQVLTGAILAIGLFEGAKGVNWKMFMRIFAGWVHSHDRFVLPVILDLGSRIRV
jgi:phosphate/sulfate permease